MPSRLKIIFGLFLTAFVVGFGLPCFATVPNSVFLDEDSGDSPNVANDTIYNFDFSDTFSFDFWVKAWQNSSGDFRSIFGNQIDGNPYDGYILWWHDSDDWLKFGISADPATCAGEVTEIAVSTANNVFDTSTWYHIVITYDGSLSEAGLHIYVDGVDETIPDTGVIGSDCSIVSNVPFWFARRNSYVGTDQWVNEFRIYNIELTSAEVLALYNEGNGIYLVSAPADVLLGHYHFDDDMLDSSGNGYDLTDEQGGFVEEVFPDLSSAVDVGFPPVEFDIDAPTSALFDTTFDISFNATSTDVVLQLCGLWSAYDVEEFNWQPVDFINTCNFQLDYFGLSVGSNSFLPMAMDIDGNIFYSDVFYIEGLDYEEPPAFSDPPTMTFTTNHTTTTVGTSINFYNNGYDDIHIKQLLVFDPQISEWINFDNPEPYPYDELLTIYAWTPETAGLFTFYAFVIDSDMQDAEPDPFYIDVLVSEVVEDDITLPLPVILPLLDPTNHFLIVAAEDLISFLRLDDLWNWFRTLFQQKFPFSWFYSIFEIWDEQRILVSSMEEVDVLKVEWVFPDTSSGFLAGQTFVLFDLQGAREHFTGFFDVIRIILINIFWLGFAGIVFFKVKKFIGELSIND